MQDERGAGRDALWDNIRLAERFLLSAMYARASSLASEVLRKLCLNSLETRRRLCSAEDQELGELVEAAGMVLVQATNEMGRLGSLISILEDHFGSVELIPHYLVFPGICLQVSSQLHYPAQLALQRYLHGWSRETEGSGCYTKFFEGLTLTLPEDVYADLAEVFVVHLLRLNDSKLALSWIEKVDLPQTRRQEMLEKSLPPFQALPGEEKHSPKETKATTKLPVRIGLAYWMRLFARLVRVFWLQAFGEVETAIVGKGLAACTVMFIMVYAFIKKRRRIQRAMLHFMVTARTSLKDFWKLAFGLQLNPLAAVTS